MARTRRAVKTLVQKAWRARGRTVLRKAGIDDAERLADLGRTTFARAYADLHAPGDIDAYCRETYSLEATRALLADPSIHCDLAFAGGAAAGYAMVAHTPCPLPLDGPSSELKRLYILPEAFGTGLGPALFDRALDVMRAAGRRHVWLSVADINPRGRPFYDRRGFLAIGRGPVFHVGGDRVPSTLMARAL